MLLGLRTCVAGDSRRLKMQNVKLGKTKERSQLVMSKPLNLTGYFQVRNGIRTTETGYIGNASAADVIE